MIKNICILTKSYKQSGYCVAGIDMDTNKWIRIVYSENTSDDAIPKSMMYYNNQPIDCFDIIEVSVIKHIPINCQTENYLIDTNQIFQVVGRLDPITAINRIGIISDDFVVKNTKEYLKEDQIKDVNRSLFAYNVTDFKIAAELIEYFDGVKYKYKCGFKYKNSIYTDVSLTDPLFRKID